MSDITLITVTDLVLMAFLAGAPGLLVGAAFGARVPEGARTPLSRLPALLHESAARWDDLATPRNDLATARRNVGAAAAAIGPTCNRRACRQVRKRPQSLPIHCSTVCAMMS